MGKQPKWATHDRQQCLIRIWTETGDACLLGHPLCDNPEHYLYFEPKGVTVSVPVTLPCQSTSGNPIRDENGNQLYITLYGSKTVTAYEPKFLRLHERRWQSAIKAWQAEDRLDWQNERQRLHATNDRRVSSGGQFNGVGRDIYFDRQPAYYLLAVGVSGVTLKPFARVRLPSSYMALDVDLPTLRGVSKNARRKAIRYGQTKRIQTEVDKAVKHYLANR
ncbi:MAG: hypothetical protein HYX84_02520 [Chloroflexi bacterium]|nr:hypothetical protein [Chloroflexota bacterium]